MKRNASQLAVAGLQIVLIEPDFEAVVAEYLRELTSRLRVLRVCACMTEKYMALATGWIRSFGHSA